MVMLEKQTCLNFGAGDHSSSNTFSFGSSDITNNTTNNNNTNTSNTPVSFSFGSTPNNTTNNQNTTTITGTTTGFSFGDPSTTVPNNNTSGTASFGPFGGSTSTTAPSFGSTRTGTTTFGAATTNTQGGFGTAPATTNTTTAPSFGFTSLPTTQVTTFGATQPATYAKCGFEITPSFNTAQTTFAGFSVKPVPVNNGEYISLTGPLGSYLIKQCADLCDLEIQILDNGTLHSTFSCNRVFFIGLSDKFDKLVKNKCVKKSEMYVLTISPEEFRSHLGAFNVQVLTNLFECIIMGSTQVHVNNSFHLLTLLTHLDLLNTMRILRDLICYSFSQHALLFATKFNNYYTEGHSYNVEMMSLFLTSINNVISGIDKITNQIAFGKINYNLLERFLSSTSKTASLRCIFHAIDIWIENNKTFASDPIQIATLLDSIQLESPKDHAQIISTISCYPSRFQFLNMLDPVMRLKLVHKHALLIK